MVEPINHQIIVSNIDEVAKINKAHESVLTEQQLNVQKNMAKEIEKENTIINQSSEVEKKGVELENQAKNRAQRGILLREKRKREKEKLKEEKPKEPFKGGVLDIEG